MLDTMINRDSLVSPVWVTPLSSSSLLCCEEGDVCFTRDGYGEMFVRIVEKEDNVELEIHGSELLSSTTTCNLQKNSICWTTFSNMNNDNNNDNNKTLCWLTHSPPTLNLWHGGEVHKVSLPSHTHHSVQITPVPFGLLLSTTLTTSPSLEEEQEEEEDEPTLFSLSHMKDEIRPCTTNSSMSHNTIHGLASSSCSSLSSCSLPNDDDDDDQSCYFSQPQEQVLFSCTHTSSYHHQMLIISYNKTQKLCSIWKLTLIQNNNTDNMDWWKLYEQTAHEFFSSSSSHPNVDNGGGLKKKIMEPFSQVLYPEYTLQKIYTLELELPQPPSHIFTSTHWSNNNNTTTLLNLVVPQHNNNVLHSYCIQCNEQEEYSFSLLQSIPCINAIGISTTMHSYSPSSSPPHSSTTKTHHTIVDICILTRDYNLKLYRGDLFFMNCTITGGQMKYIQHSCDNRLTITTTTSTPQQQQQQSRCMISTSLHHNAVIHSLLSTLDDVFSSIQKGKRNHAKLALAFRADIVLWSQHLSSIQSISMENSNIEWKAFSILLSSFLQLSSCISSQSKRQQLLDMWKNFSPYPVNSTLGENVVVVDDVDDNDEYWENLLRSDYHAEYKECHSNSMSFSTAGTNDTAKEEFEDETLLANLLTHVGSQTLNWVMQHPSSIEDIPNIILDALHFVYEDWKLSPMKSYTTYIRPLGRLLYQCHTNLLYTQHYQQDLLQVPSSKRSALQQTIRFNSQHPHPPCFLSYLEQLLRTKQFSNSGKGNNDFTTSSLFQTICTTMNFILRLYHTLYSETKDEKKNDDETLMLLLMQKEGITRLNQLHELILPSLTIPIYEAMYRCRMKSILSKDKDASYYEFIGRPDLAAIQNKFTTNNNNNAKQSISSQSSLVTPTTANTPEEEEKEDGLVALQQQYKNVTNCLCSSKPVYLPIHRDDVPNMTDFEFEQYKQEQLQLYILRTLAYPLGRGIMTMGIAPSSKNFAKSFPIPKLCLAGRIPPTDAIVQLDTSTNTETNTIVLNTIWPNFHNGVAAGLRLSYKLQDDNNITDFITRTWIVYNHKAQTQQNNSSNDTNTDPNNNNNARQNSQNQQNNQSNQDPNQNCSHGGLLLALGLRGYLSSLSMTDVYEYLTQGSITTTVGILLGMAATKKGSCDPSISKMLCLHIPSLLPLSFANMDVPSVAQTAAVTGIGLLYQGSCHRLMTEFLLNEIGGGKSRTNSNGGESLIQDREGYILSCGLALGMILCSDDENINNVGLADLNMEERLVRFMVGGSSSPMKGEEIPKYHSSSMTEERCSRIYEGSLINTNLTAPGAIFALGMMYMKTGNKSIASLLDVPDTQFLLEYVRPDFLMYRIIARSLVQWDNVQPTHQWLTSQIPIFLQTKQMKDPLSDVIMTTHLAAMSVQDTTDTDIPTTESHNNTNNANNDHNTNNNNDEDDPMAGVDTNANNISHDHINQDHHRGEEDSPSIRQAYIHILAGASFSLGLRFAGTGNTNACSVVTDTLWKIQKIASPENKSILDMCLCSCVVSLGMIMAGTCDNATLITLKRVRFWNKCDEHARYGTHMAIAASIGLLFLGGGTCTLGRSKTDIAALLLAFFPRYPISTTDNQYHLQALRHCYALAVKTNQINAIDIHINTTPRPIISLPIQVLYKNSNQVKHFTTPCQLLDRDNIKAIQVNSDLYYPISILMEEDNYQNLERLYVLKKLASLQQKQISYHISSHTSPLEFIQSLTHDENAITYAKYYFHEPKMVLTDALHHCITTNQIDALPLYLSLNHSVSKLQQYKWPIRSVWNLRIACSYYHHKRKFGETNSTPLIQSLFLASLSEAMDKFLSEESFDNTNNEQQQAMCSCFRIWFQSR